MIRGKRSKPERTLPAIDYKSCLAKTYLHNGLTLEGHTVTAHCQIVGEVAREMIARYPRLLSKKLFPKHAPLAAACHDIGKVSPTFQKKLALACKTYPAELPPFPHINERLESQWGGHAGVSQLTAKAMSAPKWVPEILGKHHGFSPSVDGKRASDELFGGPGWQAQREALVSELKRLLNMDWPQIESLAQQKLVAGLTSVADWIGSGEFFEDPGADWQPHIGKALDHAGFVRPEYRKNLSFEQVFGFSSRKAQSQLIQAASAPGVYVLEAPTGLGKTEAALYAAYRLLEREEAAGIYFALPTQLTSNKLHERFSTFLHSILADDAPQRALLLHANAWLADTEMGEEGRPGGSWFQHKKRGLLAPFAVGTVDQALMAAMHVKHGFVRAFGLAGKVVVLDEIHTYDAYTGTLLDALISLLRQLHCTVIILSATLNQKRRAELIGCDVKSDAYPLITAVPEDKPVRELAVAAESSRSVRIVLQQDDSACVKEALRRAAEGQQVLWIENTVAEAQQRYLDLAAHAHAERLEHGLLHSRFTRADRERIEQHWVDVYGKPGWPQRGKSGRILVGTQVLEQSLDIDADFLVSRFAPTDMLLQRIGRLWRHEEAPRSPSARPEAWLLAPDLDGAIAAPETHFGASAWVYSPYVLCRSLEAWQKKDWINLPADVRPLIESTYAQRQEQEPMSRWHEELLKGTTRRGGGQRKGVTALRQLARLGLAESGNTLPESKAETRYSETDSMDVLLLRRVIPLKDEKVTALTLLDGSQLKLPWYRGMLSRKEWKKLTVQLMQQQVPVRISLAPKPIARDTLEKWGFGHCFYLGSRDWADRQGALVETGLLRVALVDGIDALRGIHGDAVHDRLALEYRDDLGYLTTRL